MKNKKLASALSLSAKKTKSTHYNQSESLDELVRLVAEKDDSFTTESGKINQAATIHYLARIGAACLLSENKTTIDFIEREAKIYR